MKHLRFCQKGSSDLGEKGEHTGNVDDEVKQDPRLINGRLVRNCWNSPQNRCEDHVCYRDNCVHCYHQEEKEVRGVFYPFLWPSFPGNKDQGECADH